MLKNLPKQAKIFLLEIYNDILLTGVVPDSWQKTKIIPILKPGKSADNADFYRPISLLSCNRKLFEKIIFTRLDYWAERFELLSPTQFGFRKGSDISKLGRQLFGTKELLKKYHGEQYRTSFQN
jgi:hypothetical protein